MTTTSTGQALTWQNLVTREPRLAALRRLARIYRTRGYHRWHAYESLKRRLRPLVGWDRREGPEELKTSEAWQAALDCLIAEVY